MTIVKTETWVGWLGAIAIAVLVGTFTLLTFAYGEFETKEHAIETTAEARAHDAQILDALNRIDDKVDKLRDRAFPHR